MRPWVLLGLTAAIAAIAVAAFFVFFVPPERSEVASAPGTAAAPSGLPPDHPPIGEATPGRDAEAPHPQMGATGRAVRVPEEVRGTWRAVRLLVEVKGGGTPPQTVSVNLGGEAAVPGSTLKLRAGEFLPALQVKENEITSASNDPSNPAALVTIWDGSKQVFQGWLFGKFPDMQPFEHPKYRVTLIEGVPAKEK
jgi:hypothetical protein